VGLGASLIGSMVELYKALDLGTILLGGKHPPMPAICKQWFERRNPVNRLQTELFLLPSLSRQRRDFFSATLIKQFLGEISRTSFLNYLVGKALKRVKPNFVGLQVREINVSLRQIVDDIYFFYNNTDTQWNNTSTTDFYTLFGNSTQS